MATPCKSASPITAELTHATMMCGLPSLSQNAIDKCTNAIAAHANQRVSNSPPGIASTQGSTASGSVTIDRTTVTAKPKKRSHEDATRSSSHASPPEIANPLPTAHTSGSSVYTAAAGISALSAVTRSASDAEPNMKEYSPREMRRNEIAVKQMTTSFCQVSHLGIPSCIASGKASQNEPQIDMKTPHGEGPYGFATKKMKHIMTVAASARA